MTDCDKTREELLLEVTRLREQVGSLGSGGNAEQLQSVVDQVEADLRQSEGRFHSLFQTVGSVIILLSPQSRILEWNGEAERVYGWHRDDAVGKDFLELCITEDLRVPLRAQIDQVLEGRPLRGYESAVATRDGSHLTLVWNADRMATADGTPMGVIACGSDITGRKHLEAQLLQAQKMESIGQLAGGIAHDFNNQLGIILFDVDILLAATESGTQLREDLQKIRKVVLRSADLTRQLLVFSRRQQMIPQRVDLNQHIHELQRMLGRILGEDVRLVLSLTKGECITHADPGNIDQIIINLCVNSRDAMPGGGSLDLQTDTVLIGENYCRQFSQASPGRYCRLVVTDSGAGMEEEIRARIFEPFFTTKETGRGTGLGLSVVYGIVEAHKGWIVVDSQPGQGSRFEIFLPTHEQEPDGAPATRESPGADEAAGHGEHILILEDEAELRERTEHILEGNGYIVTSCGSVSEAREAYEADPGRFDLIVSDLVLPDGRGSTLVLELLDRDPTLGVLIVTGYPNERLEWERQVGGRHPVLQKPFSVSDLLSRVGQAFDHGLPDA